jgi:hypothetical protein|tara:strand:+ start:2494 stop:2943 length:450 start_codon:yes stop_codon:yes gene_type:complete
MKILLEGWRNFLCEQEVKYSGIVKMGLDADTTSKVKEIQSTLPKEASRLKEKNLHVTLIHQSVLKPFRKEIKNIEFPSPPSIILEDGIWEREDMGKKSWALRLKNQDEMRGYVGRVMKLLGSRNTNPEPERIFHISLANLTGNPHDSVR